MERVRVVLVTNVGQGFGRAVALAYGQAGYDVMCADPDVDLASKTASEVEELGAQAIPVQADASAQLDVRGAFAKVHEIFGALGGVVHVACQLSQTPFARLTDGEFAELFREDVTSTYLVLREASRHPTLAWVVVVAPPRLVQRPQMAAVHGAITSMASAFGGEAPVARSDAFDRSDPGAAEPSSSLRPRVNVVIPSRPPSDPLHDARLANTVRYLGSAASLGVVGTAIAVDLPPPPRVVETLLPEVQAALDDTLRQDDRDEDRDEDQDESADALLRDGDDQSDDTDLDLLEDGPPDGAARYDDDVDDHSLESEGLDDVGIDDAARAISAVGRDDARESDAPFARRRRGAG